jgi:hypothetical protein
MEAMMRDADPLRLARVTQAFLQGAAMGGRTMLDPSVRRHSTRLTIILVSAGFLVILAFAWADELFDLPHGLCDDCAKRLYPKNS